MILCYFASSGACVTTTSQVRMTHSSLVQSSWNVMAHSDAREGKWRGNWRKEWVASTLHSTSEHGVSSITTADAHTSAASSRLNWRPRRFKWTRPFRWKKKSGFCACAITFQTRSTYSPKSKSLCSLRLDLYLCFNGTRRFIIMYVHSLKMCHPLCVRSITQSCSVYISIYT